MKRVVFCRAAQKVTGPYSQAVWIGDTLYCAGQVGMFPESDQLAGEGIEEQTIQTLKNVVALLKAEGLSPEDVIKTTVFLKNINDFPRVNELYARVFENALPARSCVAVVALPVGALIEIEMMAKKNS